MDLILFFKGLVIGFAMAIPIGPMGVLCIRKTMNEGRARGLIIGLGAASADLLNGSIAAFGLTFVSDMITSQQFWLRLVGGGVLLVLGIRMFRATRKDFAVPMGNKGALGSYMSAFVLALTNPMTVFGFIAVFAALGLGQGLRFIPACLLVLGVFTGSLLWFVGLGYASAFFRKGLDTGGLRIVNKIAGGLIIISGLAAFVSLM
jgi:threonine/homoserine/homoserine lactone efflux protein